MDNRKRLTLADVADAAGVSKMSASRALRGDRDVSEQTAAKVRDAARRIGYVGNPLAMSLSNQRSDLVGVVVPSIANSVFAEVLTGIADGLSGSGLQPVFGVTDYDEARENQALRNMLSWSPAGLIVTGLDQPSDTRKLLQSADMPIVQIMDLDGTPVDHCVGLSHGAAGEAMAHALVEAGRRRFGYVGTGLAGDTRARKRLDGFRKGLAHHGLAMIASKVGSEGAPVVSGRTLTEDILSAHPDLDCLYFSNDDLATGGAFHCLANGLTVPEQITLAGFNGLDLVKTLPLAMATTPTPRREIGKTAAQIIVEGASERPMRKSFGHAPTLNI